MNRISDFTLNLLAGSESVPAEVASIAKELQDYRAGGSTESWADRAFKAEQELRAMRDVTLSDMQDRAELAEKEVQDVHLRLKASEGKRKHLENRIKQLEQTIGQANGDAERWRKRAEQLGHKKLLTKDEHMELERIVRQSRVAPAKMLQVIDRIRVEE